MLDVLQNLVDPTNALIIEDSTIIGVKYPISGELVIPDGITEIASRAFSKQQLISVFFPSSLKTIGEEAFSGCVDLVRMSFAPDAQITTIMNSAFYGCTSLVHIEIPDSTKYVGGRAFSFCAHSDDIGINRVISEVVIPKGAYVYAYCFAGTNIDLLRVKASILIPNAFESANVFRVSWETDSSIIPSHAFYGCTTLCEFTFVDTDALRVIEDSAFEQCQNLFSMQLPEGVTCIRREAFKKSGLQYFKAPRSLKAIGDYAFAETPCLFIDLEDSQLSAIGDFAFSTTKITNLTIRGDVKILNYNIVEHCEQLVCLRVGSNVEYLLDTNDVGRYAMKNGKAKFDMAIVLEGKNTKCSGSLVAPLIFLPKGAITSTYGFTAPSYYNRKEVIEGMENAYGRYPRSAGSYIYY